ncbi:MAG: hypothetical protein IJ590_01005 [Rickettsiales bacterium]|nr:hypothetical protein [Rickettsiales bacterium]
MSTDNTTSTTTDQSSAATETSTVATETNDKGFSFDWKTAAIAAAVTVGVALLILAIVMLVKHLKKDQEEAKEGEVKKEKSEKEQDKEKDKKKDNDKTKDKKSNDKGVTTNTKVSTDASSITESTAASINNLPKTKMIKLKINGVEKEYLGTLNEKTGKYKVSIPRNKKEIQDNLVVVRNNNNKFINETTQVRDKTSLEVNDLKSKVANLENQLNEKKKEQEQLGHFSNLVGNMSNKIIDDVLGKNVVEFSETMAPMVNEAAKITMNAINNAAKKEEDNEVKKEGDSPAAKVVNEDLTNMEPKVIKEEVKTSLVAANQAKEAEKGNSLS